MSMAVTILLRNNFWVAPFMVPVNKTVTIDFESSGLVDLYVLLNEQELSIFKSGSRSFQRVLYDINYYTNTVNLGTLGMPILSGASWYLILVNRSLTADIAIYFRVFNAP